MPYLKPDLTLAIVVRSLREERGVPREALAAEAGITTGSLARTELGYAAPSRDTMQRIAGALGLRDARGTTPELGRLGSRRCP